MSKDTPAKGGGYTESSQPAGICCMMQELNLVLCDNLEGSDGVGDGREVQDRGDISIPMANSFR